MTKPIDLLQGTLDVLVLKSLAAGALHGYAIAQRIKMLSREALQVQEGSLYPALHRLEAQGWVAAEWGESENKRRAKYYSLTREGRRQLESETRNWERLSQAIGLVLGAEEA